MRGGAISCIFFALLCGCRPASPAVAGAVLSGGGVRPARPLGCHPLILAKADVEDLKAGGDGGRDDEQWITGPIQILFRVGKEAAAKLGEAMKGGPLSEQEKAARDAENELIRKILKQYELNKMLHRAADKGYAAEIERLVRKGADPNARDDLDWYRMPPLTTAALRGHVRAARKLLELGARPDTQDWDQWTALHYAAYIGTARHAEVADMLLAFGADLYETTWNGKDALRLAREYENARAEEILLEHERRRRARRFPLRNLVPLPGCALRPLRAGLSGGMRRDRERFLEALMQESPGPESYGWNDRS